VRASGHVGGVSLGWCAISFFLLLFCLSWLTAFLAL
jgi:hypothetical protein